MRKFFFSILLAAAVLLGEEYKAEPGSAPPAELSDSVKGLLEKQGVKISKDGKPLSEIWFRAELPAPKPSTEANLTMPAVPHGASEAFTLAASFTILFNVLQFPAGVVPVTRVRADEARRASAKTRMERRAAEIDAGSAGLPVGVQLAARPWDDALVLALLDQVVDVERPPVEPAREDTRQRGLAGGHEADEVDLVGHAVSRSRVAKKSG